MADKIRTELELEGAEEYQRKLKGVSDTEKSHARATKESGDEAEEAGRKQKLLAGELGSLKGELLALVGGGGVVGGLLALARKGYDDYTASIEANTQAQKENAVAANQAIDQSINLRFLGGRPEDVAAAREAAASAGRDPNEGVRQLGEIASRRSLETTDYQFALYQRSLELSQFDPTVPLESFVNPMLTIQQFESDPAAAQNIQFQSMVEAGVTDPSKLSPLFAQFMGIGTSRSVGLTAGQSAGAVAAATGLGMDPSQSVTGLRNLATLLQGNGTPEGRKIIESMNLRGDNLFSTLRNMSGAYASGQLSDSDLELLFGRENQVLPTLLADPARLERFIASANKVGAAQTYEGNLAVERYGQVLNEDQSVAIRDTGRKAAAEAENIRASDQYAAMVDSSRKVLERELQRGVAGGRVSQIEMDNALEDFDDMVAKGWSPFAAADWIRVRADAGFGDSPGVDAELGGAIYDEIGKAALGTRKEDIYPGSPGFSHSPESAVNYADRRATVYIDNRSQIINTADPATVPSDRPDGFN